MTSGGDGKWKLVVVSHSHWDREWYFPFQNFRLRLVGMMDCLLNILASDPEYKHFTLDGQTILLEDYLAVRPDRRAEIERLVRAGRLLVGPWYIPPDEFLVGGEALIRNLQRGIAVARRLGGAMMVGYQADAFGQIAHLPAILRGFGIGTAVFWRGADERLEKTDFFWQAPDGSEVLTLNLPLGYSFSRNFSSELVDRLEEFRRELEPLATTRCLVLMNGSDHTMPQADLPSVLAATNATLADAELVQGNLPMVFEEMRLAMGGRSRDWFRWRGEMRSGRRSHVLPGTISARMWIKQRNQQCEDLLAHWAEPFSIWANLLRRRLGSAWQEPPLPLGPLSGYPSDAFSTRGLLRQAWKLLLENQDHDCVCGCSVDAVHREMATRFDSCQQIGEDMTRQSLMSIAAQGAVGGQRGVVVFNPLGGPRSDFVTVRWRVEEGEVPLALVDSRGRESPCQIVSRSAPYYMAVPGAVPRGVELGFVARDLPSYGYEGFRVVCGTAADTQDAPSPTNTIENDFFVVTADPRDGTITLREKAGERVLEGLNRFVDGGDRGDEYAYWPPAQDRVIGKPARRAVVSVVESGPARFTLELSMIYLLPKALNESRKRRSREVVECAVRSRVSLYPGVRRVDFRTEIDNQACDHRLRVHFPTDIQTDVSHAEQHFGVVTRPIAVPQADETWFEQPVGTYPQKAWVDVDDGRCGVLLANRGLPEYEVLPGPNGVTLALTLLRGVGWLCRADMTTRKGVAGPPFVETPDAQCLGRHTFEYALVLHEGGWQQAFAEAHRFARPLQARSSPPTLVSMPPQDSLIEVAPSALVLSAIKFADDGSGVVIRLYNIDDKPIRGRVRLEEPYEVVELVDLNEQALDHPPVQDGWVQVRARPNEILSLLFKVKLWREPSPPKKPAKAKGWRLPWLASAGPSPRQMKVRRP